MWFIDLISHPDYDGRIDGAVKINWCTVLGVFWENIVFLLYKTIDVFFGVCQ